MYSLLHDGKVLDYHYRKLQDCEFVFYVGEGEESIIFGRVFRLNTRGRGLYWSAVSMHDGINDFPLHVRNRVTLVDGFKTRTDAADYLIKISGIRGRE